MRLRDRVTTAAQSGPSSSHTRHKIHRPDGSVRIVGNPETILKVTIKRSSPGKRTYRTNGFAGRARVRFSAQPGVNNERTHVRQSPKSP